MGWREREGRGKREAWGGGAGAEEGAGPGGQEYGEERGSVLGLPHSDHGAEWETCTKSATVPKKSNSHRPKVAPTDAAF